MYLKLCKSEKLQTFTCSVIQAKASITRATTSERRTARNARLTDKASVVLPDEATAALLLIPAVSMRRNFCKRFNDLQHIYNFLKTIISRTNLLNMVVYFSLIFYWVFLKLTDVNVISAPHQEKSTWSKLPTCQLSLIIFDWWHGQISQIQTLELCSPYSQNKGWYPT